MIPKFRFKKAKESTLKQHIITLKATKSKLNSTWGKNWTKKKIRKRGKQLAYFDWNRRGKNKENISSKKTLNERSSWSLSKSEETLVWFKQRAKQRFGFWKFGGFSLQWKRKERGKAEGSKIILVRTKGWEDKWVFLLLIFFSKTKISLFKTLVARPLPTRGWRQKYDTRSVLLPRYDKEELDPLH